MWELYSPLQPDAAHCSCWVNYTADIMVLWCAFYYDLQSHHDCGLMRLQTCHNHNIVTSMSASNMIFSTFSNIHQFIDWNQCRSDHFMWTPFPKYRTHIDLREMIFQHPFGDNFYDNFLFHTYIIFHFISLLLRFPCQYYFFFVNYGCQISCHQIGCSNNTPLDLTR